MRNNNQPSGLAKLLTALLITCAVVETGIASHVGVTMQSNQEANARSAAQYEAYQERQEQVKENPPLVRYVGPAVQVSNGELVKGAWEPAPAVEPTASVPEYTPAPLPDVDVPKVEAALEVDKVDVQPVKPAEKPKASSSSTPKTASGSTKPADVPKPSSSGGQSGSQTKAVSKPDSSVSASKPVDTVKPSNGKSAAGTNKSSSSGTWGESSTTNEITGSLDRKSYWVDGGKSYHFSSGCPSLSKSKNIREGTLQDALNAGKTDPCNNCAGGS